MGCFDDDNAHANVDTSTDLGKGFLPFFSKQERKFVQQSFCIFAEETIRAASATKGAKCRRCSRQDLRQISPFSRIHGLLTLCAADTLSAALERFDLASFLALCWHQTT
jgi:hypothetical protein